MVKSVGFGGTDMVVLESSLTAASMASPSVQFTPANKLPPATPSGPWRDLLTFGADCPRQVFSQNIVILVAKAKIKRYFCAKITIYCDL